MSQLEQAPLSKFIADALGWFLLVAALTSLIALVILLLPLFTKPESSLLYQQISVYLSGSEPLVLASAASKEPIFSIGSDGRILITFFLAILALGAYGSFLSALISGAIDLFYFSGKPGVVNFDSDLSLGQPKELESVLQLINKQNRPA
jgi:hypothetical protein